MRIRIVLCLFALLGAARAAHAQGETQPEPRLSYQVCEWGLLVIEHGRAETTPFVRIEAPANFSGVGPTFAVSGEGAGLFEGNVVVEAATLDGDVLFTGAATVAADEIGGRGPWSLEVNVGAVEPATRIVVTAYSTEPNEGQAVAQDLVYLSANSEFGLPYIDIVSPIGGDAVTSAGVRVEGTAGAIFENTFMVAAVDRDGNTLAETPVTFAAPDIGLSGPWSIELAFETTPGTRIEINAYAVSMEDGETVIAGDSSVVTADLFALNPERVLVLQAGDPISMSDDICAATEGEFDNTSAAPVNVIETRWVDAAETGLTLVVDAQGPSQCDLPRRARALLAGPAIDALIYFSTADGPGACTKDLRPFTVSIPFARPASERGALSAAVNGVPADGD